MKTYDFPGSQYGSHYASASDYRLDPMILNAQIQTAYSTASKTFYPINPYNVTPRYSPTVQFDIGQLEQTDVRDIISLRYEDPFGAISLAKTVNSLISKMGAIQTKTKKVLGTCTLISEDLVITARHVIEGEQMDDLMLAFDYIKAQNHSNFQSFQTGLDYVVEDDPKFDYAIIKLKAPIGKLGYAELNSGDPFPGETALLHYPHERGLTVSVNTFDQQSSHYSLYTRCFHDSDYGSSGGAYFDPFGRLTAIHLGAELEADGVNLSRCAIKIQDIVARNRSSLLSYYSSGTKTFKRYLEPYFRDFLIDEEGAQSQRIFTELLGNAVKTDKKITLTKAKIVAFSKLDYLYNNYHSTFLKTYNLCLYITGAHAFTKQYSMAYRIESDHIIPHHVWAATTLPSMKHLVRGGGSRPGENEMPAITIPYGIHRDLRTTVSKIFHQELINLCDQDRVHRAFIKCVKEYQANGIDLTIVKIKKAIIKCLDLHIKLGVIKKGKRNSVINLLP